MATAFKEEFLAPAFVPVSAALRLVEPCRPVPPSWMCAPPFRNEPALSNPAFANENAVVPALAAPAIDDTVVAIGAFACKVIDF